MPDRVVRVERVTLLTRLRLILFRRGMLTGRFVLLVMFLVWHPRHPRRQWAEYRADQRHIRWMCRVLAELAGEQGVASDARSTTRA